MRAEHEKLSETLERERTRSGGLVARLENETRALEIARGGLEQATGELEQVRTELESEREKAAARVDKAERELADIRSKAKAWSDGVRARVESAEKELAEAHAQAEEQMATVRGRHEQVGQQLESERTRTGELEAKLAEAEQSREQARSELERATADLERARAELESEQQAFRKRAEEAESGSAPCEHALRSAWLRCARATRRSRSSSSRSARAVVSSRHSLRQESPGARRRHARGGEGRRRGWRRPACWPKARSSAGSRLEGRLAAMVDLEADARESREQRVRELETALAAAQSASRGAGAQTPARPPSLEQAPSATGERRLGKVRR